MEMIFLEIRHNSLFISKYKMEDDDFCFERKQIVYRQAEDKEMQITFWKIIIHN